jgi:hypothetical protein
MRLFPLLFFAQGQKVSQHNSPILRLKIYGTKIALFVTNALGWSDHAEGIKWRCLIQQLYYLLGVDAY